MRDADLGRLTWDANRAYCLAIGDRLPPTWDEAEEWERRSAVEGVRYHREHPACSDEECHRERLRHEHEAGWRLGAIHDEGHRRSPYMVGWDELPEAQRFKYQLFRMIVRARFGESA